VETQAASFFAPCESSNAVLSRPVGNRVGASTLAGFSERSRVPRADCHGGPNGASILAEPRNRTATAMSTVLVTGGSGFIGGRCIVHYVWDCYEAIASYVQFRAQSMASYYRTQSDDWRAPQTNRPPSRPPLLLNHKR
jgi:hypothetical protein